MQARQGGSWNSATIGVLEESRKSLEGQVPRLASRIVFWKGVYCNKLSRRSSHPALSSPARLGLNGGANVHHHSGIAFGRPTALDIVPVRLHRFLFSYNSHLPRLSIVRAGQDKYSARTSALHYQAPIRKVAGIAAQRESNSEASRRFRRRRQDDPSRLQVSYRVTYVVLYGAIGLRTVWYRRNGSLGCERL